MGVPEREDHGKTRKEHAHTGRQNRNETKDQHASGPVHLFLQLNTEEFQTGTPDLYRRSEQSTD